MEMIIESACCDFGLVTLSSFEGFDGETAWAVTEYYNAENCGGSLFKTFTSREEADATFRAWAVSRYAAV